MIGVLAVSLLRLAPYALPDPFAVVLMAGAVIGLLYWRAGTLKLMLAGSVLGVLRSRLPSLHVLRSALSASLGSRL